MSMANFLRNRKSAREFRNKKLKESVLADIQSKIDKVLAEASDKNIGFTLYKDGDKVYRDLEGIGGYAGVMVKSPHYIGLEFKERGDISEIYGAYYTEKLVSIMNDMGIEACWLTMSHVDDEKRKAVLGENGDKVDFVLAIGYPPLKNPFEVLSEKISGNEGGDKYLSAMGHSDVKSEASRFATTSGSRLGIEKIVFKDEIEKSATVEELENMGLYELFYYVRFAPSTRNLQPWRFLIKDGVVKLLVLEEDNIDNFLVDAGVIMYYFEEMMKTGHYLGSTSDWKTIDGKQEVEGANGKYRYVAEFKI